MLAEKKNGNQIMVEEISNPFVLKFWQKYLETLLENQRAVLQMPEAWGFGYGEKMADELGGLVIKGIKTATCSLFWDYEAGNETLPEVGGLSIILNGRGEPLCIIETTSIIFNPYNAVDAQFAYDEGEGDRSLEYWRKVHWHFFERTCAEIGKQLSEEMPLVCERFKVIYKP
jgi:uncharacterized protein YhfF